MESATSLPSHAGAVAGAARITADSGVGRRTALLTGAWTGVLGAVLAAIANGLHPHPSDFRLESLLQAISDNALWPAVHMTLLFALVLILASLLAMTFTIDAEPAATVSRFACLATMLGGALILVSTAMDGFAMNSLASSWVSAPPDQKAAVLNIASAFEDAQYAVYSLSVALFLGLGILLYGLATLLSGAYPKALGWLAMFSGAGALAVGVVQCFGGPDVRATEIFFVVFSFASTIWVFAMGVLMWRKARSEHALTGVMDVAPLPR